VDRHVQCNYWKCRKRCVLMSLLGHNKFSVELRVLSPYSFASHFWNTRSPHWCRRMDCLHRGRFSICWRKGCVSIEYNFGTLSSYFAAPTSEHLFNCCICFGTFIKPVTCVFFSSYKLIPMQPLGHSASIHSVTIVSVPISSTERLVQFAGQSSRNSPCAMNCLRLPWRNIWKARDLCFRRTPQVTIGKGYFLDRSFCISSSCISSSGHQSSTLCPWAFVLLDFS
jgi:hypothetical protein